MRTRRKQPIAPAPRLAKSRGTVPAPKRRTSRRPRDWKRINRNLRRIALLGLALELAWALFANPYLRVTRVQVDGAQTVATQQVFAEARVPARTNIFWMALHEPFARRLQQDPLVDHASRRIELPDTLILQVAERQPFATLASGGQYWLLDSKGVPYQTLDKPYPQVPLLAVAAAATPTPLVLGQPLHARWLKQAYGLLGLLAQNEALGATKISVDQNANICLNRRDNLQIVLGQPDSLPQKLALAQAAVTANGGAIARRAAYIDVSCPELPVWKPRSLDEDAADHPSRHTRRRLSSDVNDAPTNQDSGHLL